MVVAVENQLAAPASEGKLHVAPMTYSASSPDSRWLGTTIPDAWAARKSPCFWSSVLICPCAVAQDAVVTPLIRKESSTSARLRLATVRKFALLEMDVT